MSKLPWPGAAVMIVAANRGKERREQMESAVPKNCRDCLAPLMADSATIRKAENLPSRNGRPIDFFCISCAMKYERPDEIHDDRGRNRN